MAGTDSSEIGRIGRTNTLVEHLQKCDLRTCGRCGGTAYLKGDLRTTDAYGRPDRVLVWDCVACGHLFTGGKP